MKKWLVILPAVVEVTGYPLFENKPAFASSSRFLSCFELRTMETTHDTESVVKHRPLTIAVPTERGIVLVNHVPSVESTRIHEISCPTYRICREMKGSHRSVVSNDDQQIVILRDLLQPIKDNALKLKLIASDIKERGQRNPVSQRNDQQRSSGSGLIIASTSISLCALCGVALHVKNPSEEPRQFVLITDEKERSDCNPSHDSKSRNFDTVLNRSPKAHKKHDIDISAREKGNIISNTELVDTCKEEIKSKLLFLQRISSDKNYCQICQTRCERKHNSKSQPMKSDDKDCSTPKTSSKFLLGYNTISKSTESIQQDSKTGYASPMISRTQDVSTLTHEMFCPCMCGLLAKDESKDELSIGSLPMLKEKLIKTKLGEVGFHRDSKEMSVKTHSDIQRVRETKTQKWRKEETVEISVNEKITQLELHTQVKEILHRNIQFIKEENEYLRCFVERCHCSSEKMKLLLPIGATYGFTAVIEFLQARYRIGNGIIATLINMFRGSINVQWITERLLAPFIQR